MLKSYPVDLWEIFIHIDTTLKHLWLSTMTWPTSDACACAWNVSSVKTLNSLSSTMAPSTDLLLMVTSIRNTFMVIFNSTEILMMMMMMLRKARDLKLTQFIPPVFPRVVSERVKNDPKIQPVLASWWWWWSWLRMHKIMMMMKMWIPRSWQCWQSDDDIFEMLVVSLPRPGWFVYLCLRETESVSIFFPLNRHEKFLVIQVCGTENVPLVMWRCMPESEKCFRANDWALKVLVHGIFFLVEMHDLCQNIPTKWGCYFRLSQFGNFLVQCTCTITSI